MGLVNLTMKGDTPRYWKQLAEAKKALGFKSLLEAERYFYPARAAKRRILAQERFALQLTCVAKSKRRK
jgi:hypothetical protein